MRLDNLVKVSFVKGGARIPDVLNTEPARPPCHQAPQQLAANTEQELDCVPRRWLPLAGPAFLGSQRLCFRTLPAAPLPPLPPEHSWKEAQEKRRRHTVSWARGQVTFPIQHLYKSYLMKLRGKKN